ncbi:ribonuclease H1-like [Gigantopelta aegis]|uniref:ribonuclease H1-like n=1 Tax=Gigantopelta aegis TaxID=1735272 RepID=UPI001B889331|nr:ribonuclease H1-like [Gigantopelta aegis]
MQKTQEDAISSTAYKPERSYQEQSHISKILQRQHAECLPPLDQQDELVQGYEDRKTEDFTTIIDLPGVGNKKEHTVTELKALTLEDRDYHRDSWTQVYKDGSAENAVKNGGGGVFIRYVDESFISKSIATGYLSTNVRAEACALLEAAKVLNLQDKLSPNTVFLTDCRSLLQSLQTHCGEHILLNIRRELQDMSKRTNIILQWIPSHCGVPGNEEADRLSKT